MENFRANDSSLLGNRNFFVAKCEKLDLEVQDFSVLVEEARRPRACEA